MNLVLIKFYSHIELPCMFLSLHVQMDWTETEASLDKLQTDLTHSWEYLRAIAKHESFTDSISTEKKMKSAKFLTECTERIKVLEVVHRRVKNRFNKLLLYLGMNLAQAEQQKVEKNYTPCIKSYRTIVAY